MKEFEPLLKAELPPVLRHSVPLFFGHLVRVTCARIGQGTEKSHGTPEANERNKCFATFALSYVKKMYYRLHSEFYTIYT